MNRSPQSLTSRRRKCCRCNGVNACCKFCACARANRACTDCLASNHDRCLNAPAAISAPSSVLTGSASSSQPLCLHTSPLPDSQQLPRSQPLPQLQSTSILHTLRPTSLRLQSQPTLNIGLHVPPLEKRTESPLPSTDTPSSSTLTPPSLVVQHLHAQTLLPAIAPATISPEQESSPSSNNSCSQSTSEGPVQPPPELPSPGYILPSSAQAHCSYTATSTLYSSFCPSPSLPSSPFLAPPTEQQESLPSVQPFTLSQQTPGHVEVAIPGSISSSRSNEAVRTQTRKQCIVVGCQELIAPTMWRSHMTLHAKGIFPGGIPNFWLEEQDVYCCASCHQLVANSRSSSHSQRCKGRALPTSNPVDTPSLVPCSQSEPNPNLPSFEEVCQLTLPTLRFVPKKSRPSFARVLSATMRQVLLENSEQAWLKLFMLPKCVLPSRKRRGCHDVYFSRPFM